MLVGLKVLYITKSFYYFWGQGGPRPPTGFVPDHNIAVIKCKE